MLLRELYYFDPKTMEPVEDSTYEEQDDTSVITVDDNRKTRLTLKDINKARKATDAHIKEKEKEQEFIKQMYGQPPEGAAGGL
jgi:predicted RNA-binding protein with RPS1 domain